MSRSKDTLPKNVSISTFFEKVLGKKLRNPQWSWGALDDATNRVYLRVWKDEIEPTPDGERVLVLRHKPRRKSSGYPEREEHLNAIRKGATGLGVVCVSAIPVGNEKRQLRSFESESLLLLGRLTENDVAVFAQIAGRIDIAKLPSLGAETDTIETDVEQILEDKHLDSTTKVALVQARVGQGLFRRSVLGNGDGGAPSLAAEHVRHFARHASSLGSHRQTTSGSTPVTDSPCWQRWMLCSTGDLFPSPPPANCSFQREFRPKTATSWASPI